MDQITAPVRRPCMTEFQLSEIIERILRPIIRIKPDLFSLNGILLIIIVVQIILRSAFAWNVVPKATLTSHDRNHAKHTGLLYRFGGKANKGSAVSNEMKKGTQYNSMNMNLVTDVGFKT